jgi:hypothetical protein
LPRVSWVTRQRLGSGNEVSMMRKQFTYCTNWSAAIGSHYLQSTIEEVDM